MRQVLQGQIWTASLKETEDLVSPEAMGKYAGLGIRSVLTVAADVRPRCVAVLPQLCLPVVETGPTPPSFFWLACQFHQTFGGTLIHCNAGVNRSRAFAVALLYRIWKMSFEDAIRQADATAAGDVLGSLPAWMAEERPPEIR